MENSTRRHCWPKNILHIKTAEQIVKRFDWESLFCVLFRDEFILLQVLHLVSDVHGLHTLFIDRPNDYLFILSEKSMFKYLLMTLAAQSP